MADYRKERSEAAVKQRQFLRRMFKNPYRKVQTG